MPDLAGGQARIGLSLYDPLTTPWNQSLAQMSPRPRAFRLRPFGFFEPCEAKRYSDQAKRTSPRSNVETGLA